MFCYFIDLITQLLGLKVVFHWPKSIVEKGLDSRKKQVDAWEKAET